MPVPGSAIGEKIYRNRTIEDFPFPEIPPHDHGGIGSPFLAPNSVDSGQVKGGAITSGKIAPGAVTTEKIFDQAVTDLKIADQAVKNAKIAVDAIHGDVIKAGAIVSTKIGSGAIETPKLAAGAVTAAKLAAGSVIAEKIAAGAVITEKIAAGAVTSAKVTTGQLITLAAQIKSGIIGTAHISSLSADKITTGTLRADRIDVVYLDAANISRGLLGSSRIPILAADWIKAGTMTLGSTGKIAFDIGGIKLQLGYLGVGGMYGFEALKGYGLMLRHKTSNWSRIYIDSVPSSSPYYGKEPAIWEMSYTNLIDFRQNDGTLRMRIHGKASAMKSYLDQGLVDLYAPLCLYNWPSTIAPPKADKGSLIWWGSYIWVNTGTASSPNWRRLTMI